ncbi:isochorismatase family protein [Acuticoccus sediminis]|uniref:isochorismatase family protein n=1 Tax=Acuticoccus sediminis TaxID=2184697 RepID=UPI001CFDA64E|nr:isochorismatase family protein [Acuticoccus sediminis]
MCDDHHQFALGRRSFLAGMAGFAAGASALSLEARADTAAYADPAAPSLPSPGMELDLTRTALVVIDPQIDFMSPKGASWSIVGESVTEQKLVPHLVQLFEAAKRAGIAVVISPHYYYPWDHQWKFGGPLEILQHDLGMFDRKGPLTLDGFEGSGAEFMPELKPFIEDGKTIVCSPHKLYAPIANDLILQLGKQRIDQIILAGMAANLCVESHLRTFLEYGYEVAVVRDAVAAAKLPEGDGYLAALTNFRFIANAVWTTEETVARLDRHG